MLADEPGTGKTIQALYAAQALGVQKTLVVCPKNAFGVWIDECAKWWPEAHVIIFDLKHRRLDFSKNHPNIVITNYQQVANILAYLKYWDLAIFDESHILRNRKTRTLYGVASRVWSGSVFMLTGSPVFKGAQDLWAPLHIMHPEQFKSYWKFVNQFCHVDNNGFGWQVHGIKNEQALWPALDEWVLRRLKVDVLPWLPEKQRQRVPLEMTRTQVKHYKALTTDLMTQLREDEYVLTPTILALDTILRQLLVCPRILGIDDDGAAIKALAEDFELEPRPCVVFTPFVKAIPYITRALDKADVYYIGVIKGGMKPEDLAKVIRDFRAYPRPEKVLVASVGVATSWAAPEASTCYFLGYDWSPSINTQAEDRLHRDGQKNAVTVKYFVHEKTIDRHVLEILDGKTSIAKLILDTRNYEYAD